LPEQVRAEVNAALETRDQIQVPENAPHPAPNCQKVVRAETRAPESRPPIWPEE
jgi:hypothetical protein